MKREYQSGMRWCVWRWKDIYGRNEEDAETLYLRRLHVVQCPLGAIMVHWIYRGDYARHLHDHPVHFLSIILKGWYIELRGEEEEVRPRVLFNFISAHSRHRIIEVSHPPVITLCFASWRIREWGFWTDRGFIPWREYDGDSDNA